MGIGVFSDGVKIKTREGGMWPGLNTYLLLILNFRRVLIVVSFLLGKSPASVY